jgi:hypothetical protein
VARPDRTSGSLLEGLQGVIERTYDLDTGVGEIGRYVIGDAGYRLIYDHPSREGAVTEKVGSAATGARTMVRDQDGGLAVSLYLPDRLVECLEQNDPRQGIDDGNVDAFAVLVEELDHFLVIAERYRTGGVMSLLELELHANVTKYLVLKMFVGKMRRTSRLSAADATWIRFHLFDKAEFAEPDPDILARYQNASRLARKYLGWFDTLSVDQRPGELRRFHRLSPQAKIAQINTLQ